VTRLNFITEGQTEKDFVNRVLKEHLASFGVYASARCVETSRDKRSSQKSSGGISNYTKLKNDITNWLREEKDSSCRFTTMFDLYALPKNFPGKSEAQKITDPYQRVKELEKAMQLDIDDPRFIPYIQLHEFEALVFADPEKLGLEFLEHRNEIDKHLVAKSFPPPELINDGAETAPSKRIKKVIPPYKKVAGVTVVQEIGLKVLKEKCPHFAQWLESLERLGR